MTFFFAWVGGSPLPAFTHSTTGDIWGGSRKHLGTTWSGKLTTTADILRVWGRGLIKIRDMEGLVKDKKYAITGPGIAVAVITVGSFTTADQTGGSVTFTFDGDTGGSLDPHVLSGEAVPVTISTHADPITGISSDSYIVHLEDTTGLLSGTTYGISGNGIPQNTFFTFEGSNDVVMTNPATMNATLADLTITLDLYRNYITNIANTSGLVVGEVYQIFGRGIPAKALGTFQSDGSILLSQDATVTGVSEPIKIHRGIIYPDGGAFNESVHKRHDESVLAIKIEHSEGNFPLLTIDLKNPRIGLLAPTRNVWCWLSWQNLTSDPVVPMFHGRLVAIPANVESEKVPLQFIAQPGDYDNQRELLAETLKVAPYYDPIWLPNGVSTSDTILEARSALWHIDRTTLEVTVSDIITGEAGTFEIDEGHHLYADMAVKIGNPPLTGVYIEGSVSWNQMGSGDVDITKDMVKAFSGHGSIIGSYCGDGLFSSWPKPDTSIGGGWKVGLNTAIVKANWLKPKSISTELAVQSYEDDQSIVVSPLKNYSPKNPYFGWTVTYPLDLYAIRFTVSYEANRSWTENVSFFLEADIQETVTDSRATTESFSLNSSLLSLPIDNGQTPLRDSRYNSYFKTSRGESSFKFLLAYARAKLLARARSVAISITVPWAPSIHLSCRWNVHLTDPRLPGGQATGKVTSYELIASATEGQRARITFECSVGRGGSVAASAGVGSYVAAGYVAAGYQTMTGGTVDIGDNTVTFQSFGDFSVVDDDVNLFNMIPDNVIKELSIIGTIDDQVKAIAESKAAVFKVSSSLASSRAEIDPAPKLVDALKDCYTQVILKLNPVTGGGFISEFSVDVSKLQIPKTIDLEAPSNA